MVTHIKPIDVFPNNYLTQIYFELLMGIICVKNIQILNL